MTATRRSRWWPHAHGVGAVAGLVGVGLGLALWTPLAWIAGAGWFAIAIVELRRTERAMDYLERAFRTATRRDRGAIVGDQISGTFGKVAFEIRTDIDVIDVRLRTALPDGLALVRAGTDTGVSLGDPAFDACLRVVAVDANLELAARHVLAATVRAALVALAAVDEVTLRDGWLIVTVRDALADGPRIRHLMRRQAGLARRLQLPAGDAPLDAFLAVLADEPLASVRANNYAWLVERGRDVPRVVLQAAQDVDPDIRVWAAGQRPTGGVFR